METRADRENISRQTGFLNHALVVKSNNSAYTTRRGLHYYGKYFYQVYCLLGYEDV
jgi:hypothetical protein